MTVHTNGNEMCELTVLLDLFSSNKNTHMTTILMAGVLDSLLRQYPWLIIVFITRLKSTQTSSMYHVGALFSRQ